jgi:hypothetical protein
MSNTVNRFAQPVTYVTISTVLVNGIPSNTPVETTINAVVEVPTAEAIVNNQLSSSMNYRTIWSVSQLEVGDHFKHNSKEYKIVSVNDWSDYGYYEAIGEELK